MGKSVFITIGIDSLTNEEIISSLLMSEDEALHTLGERFQDLQRQVDVLESELEECESNNETLEFLCYSYKNRGE